MLISDEYIRPVLTLRKTRISTDLTTIDSECERRGSRGRDAKWCLFGWDEDGLVHGIRLADIVEPILVLKR